MTDERHSVRAILKPKEMFPIVSISKEEGIVWLSRERVESGSPVIVYSPVIRSSPVIM